MGPQVGSEEYRILLVSTDRGFCAFRVDPDPKRDWRIGSKSATAAIIPILSDDLQRGPFSGSEIQEFRQTGALRPTVRQFYEWKKRLGEAEGAKFVSLELKPAEAMGPWSSAGDKAIEIRLRGGRSLVVEGNQDRRKWP